MAATKAKSTSTRAKGASRSKAAAKTAPAIAKFAKDDELHAYREMLLIRRFEEKAGQWFSGCVRLLPSR